MNLNARSVNSATPKLLAILACALCLAGCKTSEANRRMAKEHVDRGIGLSEKDLFHQDPAIAEFRAAIKLDPDSAEAHLNLGKALELKATFENGDPDPAIAELRTSIRLDGSLAEAYTRLGDVLRYQKKDLDGAIQQYRLAIRANPNYAEAHRDLGTALQQKGELDAAIAEFRENVRLQNDWASHLYLGDALQAKGDTQGAQEQHREQARDFAKLEEAVRPLLHLEDKPDAGNAAPGSAGGIGEPPTKPTRPDRNGPNSGYSQSQPQAQFNYTPPEPVIDALECVPVPPKETQDMTFREFARWGTSISKHEFVVGDEIACIATVDPPTKGLRVEWRLIAEDAEGARHNQVLGSAFTTLGSEPEPNVLRLSLKADASSLGSYRLELYFEGWSKPAKTLSFKFLQS